MIGNINIQIAEKFEMLEELDEAIKSRQELRDQMVGTLYPGIVQDEIYRLTRRRTEIERIVKKNKDYGKGRNH